MDKEESVLSLKALPNIGLVFLRRHLAKLRGTDAVDDDVHHTHNNANHQQQEPVTNTVQNETEKTFQTKSSDCYCVYSKGE